MQRPLFELHILPMFRAIDREHMLFAFDLWDYDQLVQHAEQVADRLMGNMPPAAEGGPWPDEWIQLFRRWITTGYKRLQPGSAQYTWNQSGASVTIRATGTYPESGYKGWLQLETETGVSKTYVLYVEVPDVPTGGTPEPFEMRERYRAADTRSVFIHDSSGVLQIH